MYLGGFNWSMIPNDHKMLWFNELKKDFYWKENVNEDDVLRLFMDKAPLRFKDMCSRLKKSKERPPHIDEHEWVRWQQHWNSDSFKKISKREFDNRKVGTGVGEPAPPTHMAGSRSFHECAMMMASQRGIPSRMCLTMKFLMQPIAGMHQIFAIRGQHKWLRNIKGGIPGR